MILVPKPRNDQNSRAQKISREPSRRKNNHWRAIALQRDTTMSGHSPQEIAALRKEYHERDPERAPAGKLTSTCEWLELGYQGTACERPPRPS
jgi:hypothetical protein